MIQVPLTPEAFTAKAAKLRAEHGIDIIGPEGKLTKMGVTAAYVYDAGVLTVTILEKPFFVTTDYCEDQLRTFLGIGTS